MNMTSWDGSERSLRDKSLCSEISVPGTIVDEQVENVDEESTKTAGRTDHQEPSKHRGKLASNDHLKKSEQLIRHDQRLAKLMQNGEKLEKIDRVSELENEGRLRIEQLPNFLKFETAVREAIDAVKQKTANLKKDLAEENFDFGEFYQKNFIKDPPGPMNSLMPLYVNLYQVAGDDFQQFLFDKNGKHSFDLK